jgi:hypothetical protein
MILILFYVLLAAMLFSIICGSLQYRKIDRSTRIVLLLLIFAITGEVSARLSYYWFQMKNPVYHVTAVISLTLVTAYYIDLAAFRHKRLLMQLSTLLFVLTGLVNLIYFQPVTTLPTNTLRFRGLVVAVMCLSYFYKMFISDNIVSVKRHPHFWITMLLVFIYCFTYFFWSYIHALYAANNHHELARVIQLVINIISYGAFGFVFLYYPKMINNDARQ